MLLEGFADPPNGLVPAIPPNIPAEVVVVEVAVAGLPNSEVADWLCCD